MVVMAILPFEYPVLLSFYIGISRRKRRGRKKERGWRTVGKQ